MQVAVKQTDSLSEAVEFLSKYEQYQYFLNFLLQCRETKFQLLEKSLDSSERADAKIIGAMVEDDYLLKILTPQKDAKS
jgi:hypothetical protein